MDWLFQVQFLLHSCISQIVLDVVFAHLTLSDLLKRLEIIVDQRFELALYFIIDFGELALECHLVGKYFFCHMERFLRYHLRRDKASFLLCFHLLEFLLHVDCGEVGLDLIHFVFMHFWKDLITAVNFLIDVLFHLTLRFQLVLNFEIEFISR